MDRQEDSNSLYPVDSVKKIEIHDLYKIVGHRNRYQVLLIFYICLMVFLTAFVRNFKGFAFKTPSFECLHLIPLSLTFSRVYTIASCSIAFIDSCVVLDLSKYPSLFRLTQKNNTKICILHSENRLRQISRYLRGDNSWIQLGQLSI